MCERRWDAHFNISPIEKEGHFLLVPDMSQESNRRAQELTAEDCIDMARMAGLKLLVYEAVSYECMSP